MNAHTAARNLAALLGAPATQRAAIAAVVALLPVTAEVVALDGFRSEIVYTGPTGATSRVEHAEGPVSKLEHAYAATFAMGGAA